MLNLNLDARKFFMAAGLSLFLSLIIIAATSVTVVKNFKNQIEKPGQSGNIPTSEILKPGAVGEIKTAGNGASGQNEPMPSSNVQLPPVIFNTAGTIAEVKKDRLTVNGEGTNFADGKPRLLNVIYTSETLTFVSQNQKTKYIGLEGLKYLKTGDKVLIGGEENIRGKIEFKARTINVLQ